jgi:hypothetical protein
MPLFEISFEDHTEIWEACGKPDGELGAVSRIELRDEYTSEIANIYGVTLERDNLPEAFTEGFRLIQEARRQDDIRKP